MFYFVATSYILFVLSVSTLADFKIPCPDKPVAIPSLVVVNGPHCGYTVAMEPNEDDSEFLNIYLVGKQSGWVAVGFSYDQQMAYTDVLGCKRSTNGSVGVIDSWNDKTPPNMIDPNQDGVCTYEAEFINGSFHCLFSRYAGIVNEGYDYNLNDSFYLLLGCSETLSDSVLINFPYHQPNIPTPTDEMINVYNATRNATKNATGVSDDFEQRLIKAHGILMVIAFPLLLVTAVFFAAWMKPALPKAWFYIHLVLMSASLTIALIAFMLIFIANKDNPTPGLINLHGCGTKTTHFVFGILIVFLQLINPIVAIFRPKPDHPNRWIFNLVHGATIGHTVEALSLINIALGAVIYQSNCTAVTSNNLMLWLYIAWLLLYVSIQIFLYLYFTIKYYIEKHISSAPTAVKLMVHIKQTIINATNVESKATYDPINPSDTGSDKKENIVRFGAFGFQLCLTLLIVIILIVYIADGKFNK